MPRRTSASLGLIEFQEEARGPLDLFDFEKEKPRAAWPTMRGPRGRGQQGWFREARGRRREANAKRAERLRSTGLMRRGRSREAGTAKSTPRPTLQGGSREVDPLTPPPSCEANAEALVLRHAGGAKLSLGNETATPSLFSHHGCRNHQRPQRPWSAYGPAGPRAPPRKRRQ